MTQSMTSLMSSSHGMALAALATAMAVSGTMILMAFGRRQQRQPVQPCYLRPCIASAARKGENRGRAKKRVRFGENMVVEFKDDGDREDDDVKEIVEIVRNAGCGRGGGKVGEMPANRVALYSGMLRDRLQRMSCY